MSRPEAQALTRRRLLVSAADVFADKGFRAASLADVADRAGYTIGAVYSNFASKDELFQALMAERLQLAEAGLATVLPLDGLDSESPELSMDERIDQDLDRLAAAEDAVPPGWWRLLNDYRAYAATDPAVAAELSASERRCRELIARHIERFAINGGLVLPMAPIVLAEISSALTDGLRAAHAEGRSTLTSGEGLRRFVRAIVDGSARVDPA